MAKLNPVFAGARFGASLRCWWGAMSRPGPSHRMSFQLQSMRRSNCSENIQVLRGFLFSLQKILRFIAYAL